jgi:protein-S-isoprenylcysteine O-methyltransferase Ste14
MEQRQHRHGAGGGVEYPHWDQIQGVMLAVFLAVWAVDFASYFIFGYSTLIFGVAPIPATLAVAAVFFALGAYLLAKSHKPIFQEKYDKPTLIKGGVYKWIRHPMYMGGLLIMLSLFFVNLSAAALVMWIAIFAVYNRAAGYEEKELVRILGKDYVAYQKQVPRWIPIRLKSN